MRYFKMIEPIDESMEPIEKVFSEQDILVLYWKYWHNRMMEKYGIGHELISTENCIEEWCIVHWAWQIYPPVHITDRKPQN